MEGVIREAFEKLGETDFRLSHLTIHNDEGLFVPMSHLNHVRRDVCEKLAPLHAEILNKRIERVQESVNTVEGERPREPQNGAQGVHLGSRGRSPSKDHWSVYVDNIAYLREIKSIDEVLLSLNDISDDDIERTSESFDVRLVLPTIVRAWESTPLRKRLEALKVKGFNKFSITNLAGFEFIHQLFDTPSLIADWQLNCLNHVAMDEWRSLGCERVTLSPEDTFENMANIARHSPDTATVILYQDVPLMISEACPKRAFRDCPKDGTCEKMSTLISERDGTALHVRSDGCRTTLFSDTPLSRLDHLDDFRALGVRHFRLDFALRPYTPEEVAEIFKAIRG